MGSLEDREDFMNFVKLRFASECPNKGLRFYGIPFPSLKDFKNTTMKNTYDVEPD